MVYSRDYQEMDDPSYVNGAGYISDESDFHGSAKTQRKWKDRSRQTSVAELIATWQRSQDILPKVHRTAPPATTSPPHALFNRLEGETSARQLHETIAEFLIRLPPRSSFDIGPWIWIENPHLKGKEKARESIGNSRRLTERGQALLEEYDSQRAVIESGMTGKAQSAVTRKLTPLRKKLKEELIQVAVGERRLSGKWMLFPGEDQVDRTWRTIAENVANDRLGTTAKIAAGASTGSSRLICVYTKDFTDEADVKRVLEALTEMGLGIKEGRGIYYKCDAYTHWDIGSGNPYGLQASLYSSRDMLGGGSAGAAKRKA